jgi:hypothetical protein
VIPTLHSFDENRLPHTISSPCLWSKALCLPWRSRSHVQEGRQARRIGFQLLLGCRRARAGRWGSRISWIQKLLFLLSDLGALTLWDSLFYWSQHTQAWMSTWQIGSVQVPVGTQRLLWGHQQGEWFLIYGAASAFPFWLQLEWRSIWATSPSQIFVLIWICSYDVILFVQ